MSYTKDFNIFVGGQTGVFKGIKASSKALITKNIQSLMAITRDHGVMSLAWGDDREKEILMACGAKGVRSIKIYDTEYSNFTNSFICNDGEGDINGISRYDGAVLTAMESGLVKLWRCDDADQLVLDAGPNLCRMRHSNICKNMIATGGRENKLKLFDLEKQEMTFVEKNLPHDSLELRVATWISDIGFLPNNFHIATTSKYGHVSMTLNSVYLSTVRLYDPSAQRRPVINIEMKDEALTALTVTTDEKQIVVGSGKGTVNLVDLRKPGKVLNKYTGFFGGVTSLACSKTEPLLASVSLDRYLRIHHLKTKQLLKQEYLTSRLNCILLRSDFSLDTDDKNNKEPADVRATADIKETHCGNKQDSNSTIEVLDGDSEAEYDAIFDKMQVISNQENEARRIRKKRKGFLREPNIIETKSKKMHCK